MRADSEPLLYTVDDVAQMLSIGRTQVFALVRSGELRSVKIGRSRRFLPEQIQEYVDKLRRSAQSTEAATEPEEDSESGLSNSDRRPSTSRRPRRLPQPAVS
jgi:excisionase family DNA binding protein